MRPLRFPRPSLFWLALPFGLLFLLPVLALLASFTFVLEPPLERYYSLAYIESSRIFSQRGAATPIVWLYKTAPGRRRELLTERDAQSTNSGTLGVGLSPAALANGWTGIETGSQERVDSRELHAFLEANIYNGHGSAWVLADAPSFG